MTELPDNILHLPQYQVLGCKSTDDEMHFQVDVPDPIACEECGVQGEFVRFGKRDVPYRDLPIHGKRVTLWVVRRRYTCRACKTTFRPQLPEMVDGFRMTLRLHEYVEKESFSHPYMSHPGRSYGRLWNRSGREAYHSFMACIGVLLFNADCGSWWLYKVT